MQRANLFLAVLILIFGTAAYAADATLPAPRAKVTGIGGVFILSENTSSRALSDWYAEHLGLKFEDFGAAILSWQEDQANDNGVTVWGAANHDSDWFKPSTAKFMINYRVDDLERMIDQLKAADIQLVGGPEYHENGIFAWIMDPDGNKIELWQPMAWDAANLRD